MSFRRFASCHRSDNSYPSGPVIAYSLGPSSHRNVNVASLGARLRQERKPYSHQPMKRSTQSLVRETDLHLHLLAAGYTTVESPAIVDNAMHVAMVDVTCRPGEFAAHHVM